ncbi:aspartyl protease family protein [Sphingomonas gellani]|uniref:Aspartyl protease family protein n=1 Tax=Sphingomonas gellani TaxID=1166340 RepID=A0A1H7ZS44_9SPHN|nr:TIGR02281 family clan AA aspartic protease [Sphingomonas gellani]SEM60368.1 aspartyl protease family protein [Sphingomonas gellani]
MWLGILILLPLSALLARRVPILRIVVNLAAWGAILLVGTIVWSQRDTLSPVLSRAARILKLDNQSVVGTRTHIRMSSDGHFWAEVRIDHVQRRMLVDSGATVTALSVQTARALSLDQRRSVIPVMIRTANGIVKADTAEVPRLQLGSIIVRKLPVVVSPAFGDTDVLGMNFLSQLQSWRVEGDVLILVPHAQ